MTPKTFQGELLFQALQEVRGLELEDDLAAWIEDSPLEEACSPRVRVERWVVSTYLKDRSLIFLVNMLGRGDSRRLLATLGHAGDSARLPAHPSWPGPWPFRWVCLR